MFDVKTPLSKIHRASRRIASPTTFVAVPGVWGYIDNSGNINNIPTTATATTQQPQVLKPVLGNASANIYESQDIKVGSVATLETTFRAAVDGNGYQKVVGNGGTTINNLTNYPQGADLSVGYITTATATTDKTYSLLADLGKLKPAQTGEVVVARVEQLDATNGILYFETVTPHTK